MTFVSSLAFVYPPIFNVSKSEFILKFLVFGCTLASRGCTRVSQGCTERDGGGAGN